MHFGDHRYAPSHQRTFTVNVLDEGEAHHVRLRMIEEHQRKSRSEDCICVHCRASGHLMRLLQHVKQMWGVQVYDRVQMLTIACPFSHHVDQPQHGVDVIFKPEAPLYTGVYYLWPPKL